MNDISQVIEVLFSKWIVAFEWKPFRSFLSQKEKKT